MHYSLVRSLDFLRWFVDGQFNSSPGDSMTKLRKPTCKPIYRRKKINKLFAGLGSVRIVKARKCCPRPQAEGSIFKTLVTAGAHHRSPSPISHLSGAHLLVTVSYSFSLYGPPSRQIIYISLLSRYHFGRFFFFRDYK